MSALWKKIISKDTWNRAWRLMQYHDPHGAQRSFGKEDRIPVLLAVASTFLAIAVVGVLIWLVKRIIGN